MVSVLASDTLESSMAALKSNSMILPSFYPITSLLAAALSLMKFRSSQFDWLVFFLLTPVTILSKSSTLLAGKSRGAILIRRDWLEIVHVVKWIE